MTLTLIALTGILIGFLCLVIGFFMEDGKSRRGAGIAKELHVIESMGKKMVAHRRKAA